MSGIKLKENIILIQEVKALLSYIKNKMKYLLL